MKIVEQLMEAVLRAQAAQAEVDRLVAEIQAKTDGRRQKRKPRKKRVIKAAE
jgi:hypothetical protein